MTRVITVIFTCFNRKDKTLKMMKSLVENNKTVKLKFIIVDDNSNDGTALAIKQLGYDIELIKGTGNLFWCGGMRQGIARYLENNDGTDCLLVNDDVNFYDSALDKIIKLSEKNTNAVIVGATCDKNEKFTYGLKKEKNKYTIELESILPNSQNIAGDTMNANCILIPYKILGDVGNMDVHYRHSLGDYDLGYRIRRKGYTLISSQEFVGICELNSFENTWRDKNVPRTERLKRKESIKGTPTKEWFYFLRNNYGMCKAIKYSITPFIKIIIKQ